jgi:hypothetical protein
MNWKIIVLLSLFGVAVGVAGLFGLTGTPEFILWLIIFVLYAFIIVRKTQGKYFLHGFLVSLLNGLWIGIIHAAFFSTFAAHNAEAMASYDKLPQGLSPRVVMLIAGPIIGAVTGLIAGLFAWLAGKIMKKPATGI